MYDLILIHAPSIYDFRKRKRVYGPISDVIPSSPIFEMYPIGYVSIYKQLADRGFKVRIENIAIEMLLSEKFDVEEKISRMYSRIYAIDLHWLPHVHGALNIAKIIKKYHPNSPIMLGGLSATYYHEEIMKNYPFIDYIMLGDTTEPFIVNLVEKYGKTEDLSSIPNLVWRNKGKTIINNIEKPENYIDLVHIDYSYIVRQCLKSLNVTSALPYYNWLESPSGMTFIEKGCKKNCVICGGSMFSYRKFYNREYATYRKIENVISDLISIQENLGSPAFIAGDIHEAGTKYEESLLKGIKEHGIDIPIMFEIFDPAPESYYKNIEKYVSEYSIEISPESSSEEVRYHSGKNYSNASLEKSIEFAHDHSCKKMDVFFSIGLPYQKKEHIDMDIEYISKFYDKFKSWIHLFTSPIAPFIDPGSIAFEMHEKYGYNIYAHTLEDHYNLLDKSNTWVESLNYDTIWLSKEDIAKMSLESGYKIAKIRKEKNLSEGEISFEFIEHMIHDLAQNGSDALTRNYIGPIIYDKNELVWSNKTRIKNSKVLFINLYRNAIKIKNYVFKPG
ncbi:MAG: TIGR04190 family B12-binding domain/radical SAM domain protein [Thermoplasmata archaeon]